MNLPTRGSSPSDVKEQAVQFKNALEKEAACILKWWVQNMVDKENDGFYGRIDGHNRLHPKADKSISLNTQILWAFAIAARSFPLSEYRSLADRAWHYIKNYFIDEVEGGVFRMLDYRGEPVQTKKQICAQAFTIYAFSEYYRLSGNREALRFCMEIFFLLERYSCDRTKGGYLEAFSREWNLQEDVGTGAKADHAVKTMSTHLDVLAAYTNLYRIHPDAAVGESLRTLIRYFPNRFIDPVTRHLRLFFDEDWKDVSTTISFGHDIEASWLLVEAAEVLGDPDLLEQCRKEALAMARVTLREGIDRDGGCFYETGAEQYVDRNKHWWPQAEAMVGFLNAFQISQQPEFYRAAQRSWQFIETAIKDHEAGEWHSMVSQDQTLARADKAGPRKGPFHNVRACLEGIKRLSGLI